MNHGIPVFFKLWFAFIAILAVTIFSVSGLAIYQVASDPASIG